MGTSSTCTVDDSFQLYDIRVEVVCLPSAKILCGAKEGDHFTLEGEMLYLPPGQGISIYSLCTFFPTSPSMSNINIRWTKLPFSPSWQLNSAALRQTIG